MGEIRGEKVVFRRKDIVPLHELPSAQAHEPIVLHAVEASRTGLEQAEEEFRIMKQRFESGRGIQLEILDAQVSVTRARFNTVSALAEYKTALAMWLRATGRVR